MEHSVVVMDNCSIHHDEDIRQIIEDECGMANLFLPSYGN
jgi:transposase